MPSPVSRITAADSNSALRHFAAALTFETDCWDVHESIAAGQQDFVLIDVRSPALFAAGHIPGAINIPHGKIIETTMNRYPEETLFVVYCAGPHCNGAHRGALRLAQLSRPVKLMVGGITGWLDEGFVLATANGESVAGAQPIGQADFGARWNSQRPARFMYFQ